MKKWLEPENVNVPQVLHEVVGGHPLVAETLVRRGIMDVTQARAFLDPALYQPASSFDLPDMNQAVERLERAIRKRKTIGVWGDFDVDGQTATTLLVSALRDLGGKVTYHIPHRQNEGHGITIPYLERFLDDGVDVVLTCDTGIAEHEAVNYARGRNVDVIITDHHQLPPTLPKAYAAINPQRLSEHHPLHTLPGVGVAYKLIEALYAQAGREGETTPYLDLVALGIVADVAVQRGDTRYLLQRGLEVLRETQRLGLRTLAKVAELDLSQVSEEHIGFGIGPRLNALGRLDDANASVELLTTDNLERARILANQLEGLNAQRKLLTDQVYDGAVKQVEADPKLLEYGALVLANPHWHTGVVGIAANRLVERYNHPTILLASPPGGVARGSARSVEGCDITAAIAAHQTMLEGFGGHTMAAGLSIQAERIPDFRRALSGTVKQMLGKVDLTPSLPIDGFLPLGELSLELVSDLNRLAPFGAGNPSLTLASRGVMIKEDRTIGRARDHRQLTITDASGAEQRILWWNSADEILPQGRFDLAYVVRTSDFRGERQLQIEWRDARPVNETGATIIGPSTRTVVDYRQDSRPYTRLKQIQAEEADLCIWAEGAHTVAAHGLSRANLKPARALVIWTTPPYPTELQAALRVVSPQTIYLFAVDPDSDSWEAFAARLGGLIKYVLQAKTGKTSIADLAGAMAHREITIRKGIEWLAARGNVIVQAETDDEIMLTKGSGIHQDKLGQITAQLNTLLEETAAYRLRFHRADQAALWEG